MKTLFPQRIEGIRSPAPASDATLRMCATERDAVLVSIQLSGLTLGELGARIGVTKQAIHKWERAGVPSHRVRAFCNATGTRLLEQYIELQRALRAAQGVVRERDRIAAIASHSQAVAA
jgi:hypothetical protein